MLQVLHLADLHIGVENYGQFDAKRGMHQRLIDFLQCLDAAVDIAIERQVDLVLIAGDMFKTRSPLPRHQSEFAARIRRLRDAGIPVLMLIGNHDVAPGRDSANSVSVTRIRSGAPNTAMEAMEPANIAVSKPRSVAIRAAIGSWTEAGCTQASPAKMARNRARRAEVLITLAFPSP